MCREIETICFHWNGITECCFRSVNECLTPHEVDNIEGELEHLRSVLKMNGYPKKFIDNTMKTRQHVQEKTEHQSSVSLPYIGSASHKFERILKEAEIQLCHSSENKLFRSLCTHKVCREIGKIEKSAVAKHSWTNDHRIKWNEVSIIETESNKFSCKMNERVN